MNDIELAVSNYQKALENDLTLARQETILSKRRMAARRRLNDAKDALRWLEQDYKENTNENHHDQKTN